jgi:hypothetical protein
MISLCNQYREYGGMAPSVRSPDFVREMSNILENIFKNGELNNYESRGRRPRLSFKEEKKRSCPFEFIIPLMRLDYLT